MLTVALREGTTSRPTARDGLLGTLALLSDLLNVAFWISRASAPIPKGGRSPAEHKGGSVHLYAHTSMHIQRLAQAS